MKIANSEFVRMVASKSGFYIKDIDAVMSVLDKIITDELSRSTIDDPVEIQVFKGLTLGCKMVNRPTYMHPKTREMMAGGVFSKPYARFSSGYRKSLRTNISCENKEG